MRPIVPVFIGFIAAAIAGAGAAFSTVGDAIIFDPDFRETMHHYASVDRADSKTYRLYINSTGLASWRNNRTLPSGTVLAIEAFFAAEGEDGRLEPVLAENDIHFAMKSGNWAEVGARFTIGKTGGEPAGGGTWKYAGFDPRNKQPTAGLNIQTCHDCHGDRRAEDAMLSRGMLDQFLAQGKPAF
ncbi:MAG: cytochrome P460 family protein, partial [Notoacmeibacter sp.]